MKINKIAFLLLFVLNCIACSEDKLNEVSVIDEGKAQIESTELDNWILNNITKPYGIEVVYRWEKNNNSAGVFIYPPKMVKTFCWVVCPLNYIFMVAETLMKMG